MILTHAVKVNARILIEEDKAVVRIDIPSDFTEHLKNKDWKVELNMQEYKEYTLTLDMINVTRS